MKAIVCVGISASGKSTWTEEFIRNRDNWVEVNRDNVRWSILGEANWSKWKWKSEKKVTEICNSQIENASENGLNIACSDTNLNAKYRTLLIEKLQHIGYDVEIKEFDVDYEEAVRRDKLRPNSVGREVIYKQWVQWLEYKGFKKYEPPEDYLPPCVIVDVDGTIAKKSDRSPFDWHRVGEDKPISEVMDVVDGLKYMGYTIVFLSGRDACCYNETYDWLKSYFRSDIDLYMRPQGDMRKDYIVKEELFWKYVASYYNVKMVIDDRDQVIEQTWGPLGLKVIDVGNVLERF